MHAYFLSLEHGITAQMTVKQPYKKNQPGKERFS